MTYSEFLACPALSKCDLLALANGTLVADPPQDFARPPAPPLLMFDRVVKTSHEGRGGRISAEQDIPLDAWYFQCHFRSDPVQPGCLGVDAIWQLIGLYCMLRGAQGTGRALGCKEVDFLGQIRPHNALVRYDVEIRRFAELKGAGAVIAVGSGSVSVDGEEVYTVKDAKVGLFRGIAYSDYPLPSRNSRGGRII